MASPSTQKRCLSRHCLLDLFRFSEQDIVVEEDSTTGASSSVRSARQKVSPVRMSRIIGSLQFNPFVLADWADRFLIETRPRVILGVLKPVPIHLNTSPFSLDYVDYNSYIKILRKDIKVGNTLRALTSVSTRARFLLTINQNKFGSW